jgi:dihydrofolate reductase
MSKTILEIALTVDGFVAGRNDEQDWLEGFGDLSEFGFDEFIAGTGAIIIGKRSYDLGVERGWFKGDSYGNSPIFVLCNEIPEKPSEDADFRFVTSGINELYDRAVEIAGEKNVYVFGGPNLVQQLLSGNLLDEMRLNYVPILLGEGITLFSNGGEARRQLELIQTKQFSSGLTRLHYRVVKNT